jgi:hypothetical protein
MTHMRDVMAQRSLIRLQALKVLLPTHLGALFNTW